MKWLRYCTSVQALLINEGETTQGANGIRGETTRYHVNKEEWLTFSLIILCQKPGMDRNYCLIVFVVYMSYSDTWKVAKCCLYEKKSMLKKKKTKKKEKGGRATSKKIIKKGGYHRVLFTRTCAYGLWAMLSGTFNTLSVMSWQSVLLVEETGVPGKKHIYVASYWQT